MIFGEMNLYKLSSRGITSRLDLLEFDFNERGRNRFSCNPGRVEEFEDVYHNLRVVFISVKLHPSS